jgi:hypothetical protein
MMTIFCGASTVLEGPPSPTASVATEEACPFVPQELTPHIVAAGWVRFGWKMAPQVEDASGEAYCATEVSAGDRNDAQCDDEPRIEEAKEEELSRSASSQTSANLRWPKASSLMERGKSVSKTLSIASTRLIGIDFDHGSDEFYRFTKCSVMVNGASEKPSKILFACVVVGDVLPGRPCCLRVSFHRIQYLPITAFG